MILQNASGECKSLAAVVVVMMMVVVPMMAVMVTDGNDNLGVGSRDSKDGDKQAGEQNSHMTLDNK